MYHAAVNGRGDYFSTYNVNQLTFALKKIFSEIMHRRGSGASVAVNTQTLEEHTMLYQGLYDSAGWKGDLQGYSVSATDGSVADTMSWSAANKLDERNLSTDRRHIYTYDPDADSGVVFDDTGLSSTQKS